MADADSVLLLGKAAAGKTTLLAQLHGRLQAGEGQLRMLRAPASLKPVQDAVGRLEQGLAVEHTPQPASFVQVLHAADQSGHPVDMSLPDYAGETLADVVAQRRISTDWRERIDSAGQWILLLRMSQQPELPDVVDRPVAAAHDGAAQGHVTSGAPELPLDLWTVELLQILLYVRRAGDGTRPLPQLTVAISCWDELDLPHGTEPARVLAGRAPLVTSFCDTHWPSGALRIVGLSAQGQSLHRDGVTPDFVDLGPQRMGWLVLPDGTRDPDLTRLLAKL